MIIGKKHFIIAAMLLALGAAVYLNWQFSPDERLVTEAAADYVNFEDDRSAEYAAADDTAVSAGDILDEEAVEAARRTSFFDKARADRKSTREASTETLEDILNDPSMSESQKNEAIGAISKLALAADSEAAIETLVKAKGYSECVVVISDTQVNVIIPATSGGMTSADAAVIRDIVMGQTDMPASSVKVVEAK